VWAGRVVVWWWCEATTELQASPVRNVIRRRVQQVGGVNVQQCRWVRGAGATGTAMSPGKQNSANK